MEHTLIDILDSTPPGVNTHRLGETNAFIFSWQQFIHYYLHNLYYLQDNFRS